MIPARNPMPSRALPRLALLLLVWSAGTGLSAQPLLWLGPPEHVAQGVDFYKSADPSLVDPAGKIAVFLLRLDPARVRLASVHAHDEVMGLETVDGIAARHRAVAAVNGGFFNTRNGDPQFVLKEAGDLVSDAAIVKGIVAIKSPARGKTALDFDQASARVLMKFKAGGRAWTVPIAGVDTTRERGKLMLYNARYHPDTDTAANGTEWVLSGRPLRVVTVRKNLGRTPIPPDGSVLSFGGLDLPEPLPALAPGVIVTFETTWTTLSGLSAKRLNAVDDVVSGAGLLRLKRRVMANWESAETLSPQNFINMRHPRTLIGVDAQGFIWLAAIDGRQPDRSVGMNFADLERLCDRLHLISALNLDGGGSTTMVIKGTIVNTPSDATGPRPVSDAILVSLR
jgi:hypothetical protein